MLSHHPYLAESGRECQGSIGAKPSRIGRAPEWTGLQALTAFPLRRTTLISMKIERFSDAQLTRFSALYSSVIEPERFSRSPVR